MWLPSRLYGLVSMVCGEYVYGLVGVLASLSLLLFPFAASQAAAALPPQTPRHVRDSTQKALSGAFGGVVALETLQARSERRTRKALSCFVVRLTCAQDL